MGLRRGRRKKKEISFIGRINQLVFKVQNETFKKTKKQLKNKFSNTILISQILFPQTKPNPKIYTQKQTQKKIYTLIIILSTSHINLFILASLPLSSFSFNDIKLFAFSCYGFFNFWIVFFILPKTVVVVPSSSSVTSPVLSLDFPPPLLFLTSFSSC